MLVARLIHKCIDNIFQSAGGGNRNLFEALWRGLEIVTRRNDDFIAERGHERDHTVPPLAAILEGECLTDAIHHLRLLGHSRGNSGIALRQHEGLAEELLAVAAAQLIVAISKVFIYEPAKCPERATEQRRKIRRGRIGARGGGETGEYALLFCPLPIF